MSFIYHELHFVFGFFVTFTSILVQELPELGKSCPPSKARVFSSEAKECNPSLHIGGH